MPTCTYLKYDISKQFRDKNGDARIQKSKIQFQMSLVFQNRQTAKNSVKAKARTKLIREKRHWREAKRSETMLS